MSFNFVSIRRSPLGAWLFSHFKVSPAMHSFIGIIHMACKFFTCMSLQHQHRHSPALKVWRSDSCSSTNSPFRKEFVSTKYVIIGASSASHMTSQWWWSILEKYSR